MRAFIWIFLLALLPQLVFSQCRRERIFDVFGQEVVKPKGSYRSYSTRSLYVPMRDSVLLAVDVCLPRHIKKGDKIPAIFIQTRYWRDIVIKGPPGWFVPPLEHEWKSFFTQQGYALVLVDVRGTGASFGTRPRGPWSEEEIKDGYDLVEWAIHQPWSNQKVGAIGISYAGNTAALLGGCGHPAVKAVIPMFSDFDVYEDLAFPGGVPNERFLAQWAFENDRMDRHDVKGLATKFERIFFKGVKPVDGDRGKKMLKAAIKEHEDNISTYFAAHEITYRDDPFKDMQIDELSPFFHQDDLEKNHVAVFSWGGWMDAGTALGVIKQLNTYETNFQGVIGPWDHGGSRDASQYLPEGAKRRLDEDPHHVACLEFFDQYLKEKPLPTNPQKELRYYTMGEDKWKTTSTWPVAGTTIKTMYFGADSTLRDDPPEGKVAPDWYDRHLKSGTGWTSRWWAQMGRPTIYRNRKEAEKYMIYYTTSPMEEATEITGFPVIKLNIASTVEDCLLFVYLEEVDPSGKVTYITEGQFRTLHRKTSKEEHPFNLNVPYHTYLRADGQKMPLGEVVPIEFAMMPTSVLVKKGHRLRVSIALHDHHIFAKIPGWGATSISISKSQDQPSLIELPIIDRDGGMKSER